ncbi:serine hydrolase domain-containing protein [Marinicaulis aureus]|uniref:Serine hydrolase domain-containing protein n=1 Tax=Hyphococcus aureus TaxID=2666033 RepID=A0ABW1L2M8_9PROT
MTFNNKTRIAVLLAAVLVAVSYFAAPVYLFFAEDHPGMTGPFGWITVPDEAPYTQGVVDPRYSDAAKTAQAIMAEHRAAIHAPALSAAIAVDGELVWSAASGWADIDSEQVATPETLFRIGSTSKAVTGTLFARLVEAGLVDVDARISTYLPTLPNDAWKNITPRQLASHTAGIPSYEGNRDYAGMYRALALREHHEDVAEGLSYFDGSPLLFEPGDDFEYTSFDTVLLSVVLQEAGGAPFQQLMKDWVTNPLRIETPSPDAPGARHAQSYLRNGDKVRPWWKVDLSHKLAGGGFMATPSDLALMGSAWLDDEFISAEIRDMFWTPQRLNDGSENEQGYAMNWRFADELWWTEGMPYANANHGGVSKGSQAWLIVIPEKRMTIALAINTRTDPFSDFGRVHAPLAAAFLNNE